MINFIVNVPGKKDAQIAGKIISLEASMRVFSEEISILIGRLSNQGCPQQCGWASSVCLGLHRTERQNKASYFIFLSCDIDFSPAQEHWSSCSGDFEFWTSGITHS